MDKMRAADSTVNALSKQKKRLTKKSSNTQVVREYFYISNLILVQFWGRRDLTGADRREEDEEGGGRRRRRNEEERGGGGGGRRTEEEEGGRPRRRRRAVEGGGRRRRRRRRE